MDARAQVGAYRMIRRLGEGGMGSVWLAEHETIGRKAAIKMLHERYADRQEIVHRFFNEARAATQVSDPGIVQIFDFGTTPDGRAYLVMELLEGEALDQRLERTGKLPVAEALRIMRQVASTLGAAHDRGIVHRDLKPENVFIVRDGEVVGGERAKVLDFGIAKLNDDPNIKTRTNTIMGTPQYMSPEQCRGAGSVDARSDVYALGCMLYALLTGRPPFVAEGHGELIVAHLQETPPPLSSLVSIPEAIEAIVVRCLAKDPDARFPTGSELARAIGVQLALVNGTDIAVTVPRATHMRPTLAAAHTTLSSAATEGTFAPPKRSSSLLAIGSLVVVVLVGGGVAFMTMNGREHDDRVPVAMPLATPVATPAPVVDAALAPKAPPATIEPPAAAVVVPRVEIPIHATPQADVYVGHEKTPRGRTPFTLELAPTDAPVTIKLVAVGYRKQTRTVSPTDTKIDITLRRSSTQSSATSSATSTTTSQDAGNLADDPGHTDDPGDADDTMNPFAKRAKP